MDYKEKIEQAKRAAVKWREKHPIVGVGELRVDCMVDDLCRYITDLLSRAESAEARAEKAEERANRWEEEVKAYSESELAKAHDLLSADWAKQKIRADEAEFRLKESEEEIKRLKEIMKGDGIVFIPSKYPGGRGEWNF